MGPRFRGDDMWVRRHRRESWLSAEPRQFAFTHFVDEIFTTLLETLFTKAFDVIARFQARACVWRAGRGD